MFASISVALAGLLAACAAPQPAQDEESLRPAFGTVRGQSLEGHDAWALLSSIESALADAGYDVESEAGTLTATRDMLVREGEHRVRMIDPNPDPDPLAALDDHPDDQPNDRDTTPELRTAFVPAGEFEYAEIVTTARVHVRATREGRVLDVRHEVETDPPGYLFHPEVGYGIAPVDTFWDAYKPVVLGGPAAGSKGNANTDDGTDGGEL